MNRLYFYPFLVIYLIFLSVISGDNITTTIKDCPKFEPRNKSVEGVLDLRADDISYIASMGDSVMAGFGMDGYKPGFFSFLNPKTLTEYRGKNFVTGADRGATTFANFLKYYNPNIEGGSVGKHLIRSCDKICPLFEYSPRIDKLNAARAGAGVSGLNSQIDYIERRLKRYPDYKEKWKMFVLQIGSNDACKGCLIKDKKESSIEFWISELEKAIIRIKDLFPKTIIYMLGNFNISNTLYKDGKLRPCTQGGIVKNYELCPCGDTLEKVAVVDETISEYNYLFHAIANKFAAKPGDNFGIIYLGITNNQSSLPFPALSNIDCFHPSTQGHEWLAKIIWNDLFANGAPSNITFDPQYEIICPLPSQRLPVVALEE